MDNKDIIALSKIYQASAEELAEIQVNAGCFAFLSNGSMFLSHIPVIIKDDRQIAKLMAQYARENVHAATLENCEHILDIRTLDNKIKNLIAHF